MVDKVAVVAGGTRGLGRALSIELAEAGYRVIALWNGNDEAARSLRDEWERRGLVGSCIRHDLGGNSIPDLSMGSTSGEIVLVYNASAPFQPRPLHLLAAEEAEAQWFVAARGFLLCLKSLLRPMLRASRSTVVAVASQAINGVPPKGFAGYLAAKAGLVALAQSLAVEYGVRGVRVLVANPGFMRTSLTDAWDPSLRNTVALGGESDPSVVSHNIRRLVEDMNLPARGEGYDV